MNFSSRRKKALTAWSRLEQGKRPAVFIGSATCGLASGAGELLEQAERFIKRRRLKVDLVPVGCIGMCFIEPLVDVRYPGQPRICYSQVTPKRLEKILEQHVVKGNPVARWALGTYGEQDYNGIGRLFDLPMLKRQVRVALRNCGIIDPQNFEHYLARGGYLGLERALTMPPEQVIQEVVASGLRGRGGGGFPTGQKWKFCRAAQGDPKYLICNADEGDPGAFMDRSVLEGDPHSVLEGMCIAAYAIGARHGYVYIRAEYPLAIKRLQTAIAQMRQAGLLGDNVLGSDFSFDIIIKEGAGAFVCGEETALIASIEGQRGMPRPRPPFPAVRGLFSKPTNINNVETLANVSSILREGAGWFARFGTEKSKGTKTFALAGKINRPGLIEVPMGMTLGEVVEHIGGGIPGGKKFKAAQTGGPSGGCLPPMFLDTPIDYENLAQAGSIMGSGGLVVMDEATCMVDLARYFLTFTQSESCGKCTPCRVGTREMLSILERICAGEGREGDIELLEELGHSIKNASLCGLGQTAPNPVLTTIKYFRHEYEEHIKHKHCRAAVCKGLVDAPCHHTCPAGVKAHRYVRAISRNKFDEAYLVVRESMPLPSVCGLVCFHPCESRCRRGSLDEPIAIRALKGAAVKYGARAEARTGKPAPRTGKKVAVVGSGPAGLTAAYYLSKVCGHQVTVFEQFEKLGGMLRYGIPRYRLGAEDLDRDIAIVRRAGVKFKTRTRVESSSKLLKQGFDAVFLSLGAHQGLSLRMPGEKSPGVTDCVQFLREVSRGKRPRLGQEVVVIGGGNSAIDAARTARRLGARVTILYRRTRAEMPADPHEIGDALEEGVVLEQLVLPVAARRRRGRLEITCQRMELGPMDDSGRRRPVPIAGSDFTVTADTLLAAIGQQPEIPKRLGVEVGRANRIAVNDEMVTSHPGVFAAGDAVSGPASVVEAIGAARRAARAIDIYLGGSGDIDEVFTGPEDLDNLPAIASSGKASRRVPVPVRPVKSLSGDFLPVEKGYTKQAAVQEARRCLRCDLED